MLGFETADDRRVLQQEGGQIVATITKQSVVDAYTAFAEDGTPISISVSFLD
jgi:hypothetical protein